MLNAGGAGGCGRLYVFMNFPHLPQPKTDLREVRAGAPRGYGGAAAPQTFPTGVTATFDMVNKYRLLIKILMEPPALFMLQTTMSNILLWR